MHQYLLWVCVLVLSLHFVDVMLSWGKSTENKQFESNHLRFVGMSVCYMIFAICCASLGWIMPQVSLMLPTIMLFIALLRLFRTVTSGKANSDLLSCVILLLPVSLWTFHGAWQDMVLTTHNIILALIFSIVWQWYTTYRLQK